MPAIRPPSAAALLAGALFAVATAAQAAPQVTVTAGQPLQLKGQDYGPGAVDGLTHDLARTVGQALSRSSAVAQVQLVLQDASPSRPLQSVRTASGAQTGGAQGSLSLGGAWIDGFLIGEDGKKTPLGFSYYQSGLAPTYRPGLWADAHRAFGLLAQDLAQGRIPKRAAPGDQPPTGQARYPD